MYETRQETGLCVHCLNRVDESVCAGGVVLVSFLLVGWFWGWVGFFFSGLSGRCLKSSGSSYLGAQRADQLPLIQSLGISAAANNKVKAWEPLLSAHTHACVKKSVFLVAMCHRLSLLSLAFCQWCR